MGGYITGDGGGIDNFGHGGGQVLMGGEMALVALDGGVSPPSPPILDNPDPLVSNVRIPCTHTSQHPSKMSTLEPLVVKFLVPTASIHIINRESNKQAGAELCQAQLSLS